HGTFHTSTNECPPTSRFEVLCERGRIEVNQGDLKLTRFKQSLIEKTASDPDAFGTVAQDVMEYPGALSSSHAPLLAHFYDNFAAAIEGEAGLICPGGEALKSVELANAMLLSSALERKVALPLDRDAFNDFLYQRLSTPPVTASS